MKKILWCLMMMLCATGFAQTNYENSIWFQQGSDSKLVFEFKSNKDHKIYNYFYAEGVFDKNKFESVYLQYARDQRWWKAPVFVHAEFRAFIDKFGTYENVWLGGPSFEVLDKPFGYIDIQTLYRYDGKSNYQLTLLSEMTYKRFYYTMFADMYGTSKIGFHSENRFFFNVWGPFKIGVNCILTVNELKDGFKAQPLGIVRVDI